MHARVLAVVVLLAPGPAVAAGGRVMVHFTGTVSSIDDPVGVFSTFSVGDPVVGEYSYDSEAADGNADPAVGAYVMPTPPNHLLTEVSGTEFSPTEQAALFVDVTDNAKVPSGDGFTLQTNVVNPPECAATGSYLIFRDSSGTAFSGDALPLIAPDLAAFSQHVGFVQSLLCGESQDSPILRFDVDSVTTVQTPIPTVGAWGLMMTALMLATSGTLILRGRCLCA